jgi:hypothetical protein
MLEKLSIEKTTNSPEILMDAEIGLIEISGASFQEDSVSFYAPVFEWIEEYISNPKDTVVNVELKYFNSSSAKIILNIFKSLGEIKKKNLVLVINWKYNADDEDVKDSGQDFAKLSGLEFNLIEKEVIKRDF